MEINAVREKRERERERERTILVVGEIWSVCSRAFFLATVETQQQQVVSCRVEQKFDLEVARFASGRLGGFTQPVVIEILPKPVALPPLRA